MLSVRLGSVNDEVLHGSWDQNIWYDSFPLVLQLFSSFFLLFFFLIWRGQLSSPVQGVNSGVFVSHPERMMASQEFISLLPRRIKAPQEALCPSPGRMKAPREAVCPLPGRMKAPQETLHLLLRLAKAL
jgi:hypothetical protein